MKNSLLLLLCIVMIIQVSADFTQCLITLSKLGIDIQSQNIPKIVSDVFPYISKSGLSFNQWGDFDACKRDQYIYSTMLIYNPAIQSQYIGICHSNTCTAQDLNQNKEPIIQALKSIGIDLSAYYFEFKDPSQTVNPPGFGTYFIIFIICTLVVFSLVIPFYHIYVNFINRKQRYQKIYSIKMNINSITNEGKNGSTSDSKDVDSGAGSFQIESRKSQAYIFFEYFSLPNNFKSLMDLKTPDPNLCIFNGFRSFAFLMVIYGHQHSIILSGINLQEMILSMNSWWAVWLMDMLFSVDTFFWIGGFFLGFVACEVKKLQQIKKGGVGALFIMIVHRVLRIWPCYFLTMMILWKVFPYLGEGPRWFQQIGNADCQTWWRNMLFIDNLFDDNHYCMGWGWYLSNDMQLFLVCLIPIYLYAKVSPLIAKITIVVLLIASQIVGTIVTFHYGFLIPYWAFVDQSLTKNLFDKYYMKPWCRGSPYFLGLLMGIMYREYKNYKQKPITDEMNQKDAPFFQKIKSWTQNRFTKEMIISLLCYITGGGILGVILFGWRNCQLNGPDSWNQTFQKIWFAFCRLFFAFGLTLISISNFIGIKDLFNTSFMNCGLFRYLAKISFTGYMIHYIIVMITASTYYEAPSFTTFTTFQYFIGIGFICQLFLGDVSITIIAASLLCLLVEMPFSKVETALVAALLKSIANNKKKPSEKQLLEQKIENE